MASATITVTDSMRVSSLTGSAAAIATLSYLSSFAVSATRTEEIVILTTTTSDFLFSAAFLSNIQVFQMVATDTVRVNFGNFMGGASYVSNASAGMPLTFLAFAGSGISGPLNLHLAYSGNAGSATVRIMMAQ
jgi:hypothetical protein